jgi:hypothetical protein
MRYATITIIRYCEDTDVETAIEVNYQHHAAYDGGRDEPSYDAYCEVWPVDPTITLTTEETSEARVEAMEDYQGRRDDYLCMLHEARRWAA